jgi:hypothetical protein
MNVSHIQLEYINEQKILFRNDETCIGDRIQYIYKTIKQKSKE